ncbi:MAG: sel1 repeat family protein [Lachnospiraceae bacterium]|nr:sel1 repeat family protein [Lachnospiraceae bacterium]
MTDAEITAIVNQWTDFEKQVCTAPEDMYDSYREAVYEGAKRGIEVALETLAYASYGGNNVFGCDWELSEKCLLKLIDVCEDPSPHYYNTLGYIYYYGRTTGGVPQYEKAFQYYAVGAVHGIFESMYKVSDMLRDGKGVPRNVSGAAKMIISIYRENKSIFTKEQYGCKFADVALRLGGLFERGEGVEQSFKDAYSLYLQARLAIKKRMEHVDYFGDAEVEKNIAEAVERCRRYLGEDFFRRTLSGERPYMVLALMEDSVGLDMSLAENDGTYYLLAKRVKPGDDDTPMKQLFTLPEMDMCMLSDKVIMRLEEPEVVRTHYENESAYVNHIYFDKEEDMWVFAYMDYPVIEVKCAQYSFGE